MKFFIIFFISAILIGCSASGRTDCNGLFFYKESDFTSEEVEWIQESAKRWNTFANHTVLKIEPGDPELCVIHNGTPPAGFLGWYRGKEAEEAIIGKDLIKESSYKHGFSYKDWFEATVMHELGHGIHMVHVGTEPMDALMSPAVGLDFTDLDWDSCLDKEICIGPRTYFGSIK